MKFGALLFGVGVLFTLAPTAALATTTPAAPQPYCTLSASQGAVEIGQTTNLSWSSQYATQGFITSIGTVGTAGTQGVIPTAQNHTYTGTFTGPGGTGNCNITISVIQPSGGGVGDTTNSGTVTNPGSTGIQNPGLVNPTAGHSGTTNTVDEPGSSGVLYPGTVAAPDKLPPSQSASAPPVLPPANDLTLSTTQSKGLIPCGNTTGLTPGTAAYYAAATSCQACSLASLAQNIINFLLGLSIPLAAVMFAYAGVIYFSSGVETSINKIEKAHAIFRSVGIGFLIVLSAWLGVQTVLKTILSDGSNGGYNYYANWNTIQCLVPGARPMNKNISELLSVLPGLNTLAPAPTQTFDSRFSAAPTPSCDSGYQIAYDMGGNQTCWNSNTDTYKDPAYSYSGTSGTSQWNQQLAEACSKNGLNDCLMAQSILLRESGGQAGAVSNMGAGGLMQLMPATACGLNPTINGCSTGDYNAVRQVLTTDPQLNMDLGTQELARLYNKYNGDVPSIAAAYNGGDKANVCGSQCQSACGGQVSAAWQCAAFPGYAETRKYVPNVVATYTSLKK